MQILILSMQILIFPKLFVTISLIRYFLSTFCFNSLQQHSVESVWKMEEWEMRTLQYREPSTVITWNSLRDYIDKELQDIMEDGLAALIPAVSDCQFSLPFHLHTWKLEFR